MKTKHLITTIWGSNNSLPYTLNPANLPNGGLPSPWVGGTFVIEGGVIKNYPVLGSNLLANGGFEGAYTGGLAPSWTKDGTPTISEETGTPYAGTSSQNFTATAFNNAVRQFITPTTTNRWYVGEVMARRNAGTGGTNRMYMYQVGGIGTSGDGTGYGDAIVDASYTLKSSSFWVHGTGNLFFYATSESGSSNFDSVTVDDAKMRAMSVSEPYALMESGVPNVVIKIRGTQTARARHQGIIARADNVSNPQNYILAWYLTYPTVSASYIYASLAEVVNGVMTLIINKTYVVNGLNSNYDFELRLSGSTASIYYNGTQIGTNQTVNVLTGTKHGIFSTGGGNSVNRFFLQAN